MNEKQSNPDVEQERPEVQILLALDKEKGNIWAVKGLDENGNLQTVAPESKNQNQFLRIDKHGSMLSNFLTNFFSQLRQPSRFSFFPTSVPDVETSANNLQHHLDNPTKEGAALLEQREIKQEHSQKNKHTMENPQTTPENNSYRYQPEQIDWKAMASIGLSKERLEKLNVLEPLLKGYKTTELVPLHLKLGVASTRMDARLSLQANDDGQVVVAIHGIRKEPQLNYPFFGHEFSKEDKDNLLRTGNMGRVVDLVNPRTTETIPSIVSVDRLTNELIALRADKIKLPDDIKGVLLNDEQKQTLSEGKPLFIEGMTSKKGEPFDATVQFNADKRYVEFLFDRNGNQQAQRSLQGQPTEAPRTIRGKKLDDEQYQKFNNGQTIYLTGLVDRQGKEYKGYLTFNKDSGKTDFSFNNPNAIKDKVQPSESHKTQVAVNDQGKTDESTKRIKEPLKSGQKEPDNRKQQEEQEKAQTPTKSRGRKM